MILGLPMYQHIIRVHTYIVILVLHFAVNRLNFGRIAFSFSGAMRFRTSKVNIVSLDTMVFSGGKVFVDWGFC